MASQEFEHEKKRAQVVLKILYILWKDTLKNFVRAVAGAQNYMVVITLDQMLDIFVRFCVVSKSSHVLMFDLTFSLSLSTYIQVPFGCVPEPW